MADFEAQDTFSKCRGYECAFFEDCQDDPRSLWPSIATPEDVKADCDSIGDELQQIAPKKLEAAGYCPTKALGDIQPGATRNPIRAFQNAHIRKQLGIEYINSRLIIY